MEDILFLVQTTPRSGILTVLVFGALEIFFLCVFVFALMK